VKITNIAVVKENIALCESFSTPHGLSLCLVSDLISPVGVATELSYYET